MLIKKGLCQCGCGEETTIAKCNDLRNGWIKGQPIRFINGHNASNRTGLGHPNWNGGKTLDHGYVLILKPDHPKANYYGYVREHILIAEKVLGKLLPEGAVVHHINENKADNRKENLVICENDAYHQLLHRRMRALKTCGNPNWRKCWICKEYDDPENLYINNPYTPRHKECMNQYLKQWKAYKKRKAVN